MKIPFFLYKKISLICIILYTVIGCVPVSAQNIIFSRPQDISNKITHFDILGRVSDGLLLYKWGERHHNIESYSLNDLSLKWTKDILLPDKNARIIDVLLLQNELMVFYTVRQKKTLLVYMRRTDPNLIELQPDTILDTLTFSFGSSGYEHTVEVAQNRKYISLVRKNLDFSGIESLNCKVINLQGIKVADEDILIPKRWLLEDISVAVNGDLITTTSLPKRNISSNTPQISQLILKRYSKRTNSIDSLFIDLTDQGLIEFDVSIDDLNEQIVLGGFFTANNNDAANGYFYATIAIKDMSLQDQRFEMFNEDLLRSVRPNLLRNRNQVEDLALQCLIPRRDGGALLIGESLRTTTETSARAGFTGFYTPISGTNHYFNDILMLSINPNGDLLWENVLQKNQFSENDNGYYSSFGLININKELNLLFNEEISNSANLSTYTLGSDGEFNIKSIINANEYNLLIAPKHSKQIAANTIVLPAFNKRSAMVLIMVAIPVGTSLLD